MSARLAARWAGKLVVDHGGRRTTLLLPSKAVTVYAAEPGEAVAPSNGSVLYSDNTPVLYSDNTPVEYSS